MNEKIKSLLSKEKNPYKTMAIGEHNGHYFFGSVLQEGEKKVPIVVLDNGEVYWDYKEKTEEGWRVDYQIKNKFGLNYRYILFDDCIDNLWSNKSIKEFISGKSPQQTFEKMFEAIKNKNKELIYHIDDRIHSFVACDIISNYFYPLFNAKGRTYFQADFGSGKSRQSLIYQKLSFNSLFASNISPASFERVIESTGGSIIVDNFDNVNEELKKAILQIIEVYYKKGGKNIKATGQNHKPTAFNGYSPLVINNIVGLPEVSESRCNKIQMIKSEDKSIVDVKINEKDEFWSETKDNLHILALQNWEEVKETYDELEVEELSDRDLERAEAVLTIAKCIGEEVYKELLEFLVEILQNQSVRDVQDKWEFILFEYLNEVVKEGKKEVKIKDITEAQSPRIITNPNKEREDKLKFSQYCGKVLRSIPLFKPRILDGYPIYEIDRTDLTNIIKIKGYDKYLDKKKPKGEEPM